MFWNLIEGMIRKENISFSHLQLTLSVKLDLLNQVHTDKHRHRYICLLYELIVRRSVLIISYSHNPTIRQIRYQL